MLLNEIHTSDDRKIQKINKVLKETYGFTLVSEIKTGTLNTLYTQIADDLYDLKLDLNTAKDPAYIQKVLVLEGLKILITKNNKRLEEASVLAGKGGRAFDRILADLTSFVEKVCNMGDEYEEAIKDAMKHYRSSIYRFPDEVVEYELRKATVDDCTDTVMDEVMYEAVNEAGESFMGIKPQTVWWENDPDDLMSYIYKKRDQLPPSKETGAFQRNWQNIVDQLSQSNPPPADWVNPIEVPAPREQECPQCRGRKAYPSNDEPCSRCDATGKVVEDGDQLNELDKETYASYMAKSGADAQNYAKSGMSAEMDDDPDRANSAMRRVKKRFKGIGRASNALLTRHGNDPEIAPHRGDLELARSMARDQHDMLDDELDEGGDRHAEHDWVKGMKKDAGMDSGPGYEDDTSGLSLLNPEDDTQDDADDFFSYRSKQKRTEMKEGYVKELRKLLEAETDQAESLIAAKSFSQELQDMVEKLGRLVNENLPAVSEQMRDAYGSDVATGFEDQVSGTLNTVMDSLRNSKQEIDNSVTTIADGGAPVAGNDMESYSDEELGGEFDDAELELDGDVELDLGDEELGDEFGGDDAMAGLEDEPLGRAKKEALVVIGKKLVETKAKLARIKARK